MPRPRGQTQKPICFFDAHGHPGAITGGPAHYMKRKDGGTGSDLVMLVENDLICGTGTGLTTSP